MYADNKKKSKKYNFWFLEMLFYNDLKLFLKNTFPKTLNTLEHLCLLQKNPYVFFVDTFKLLY